MRTFFTLSKNLKTNKENKLVMGYICKIYALKIQMQKIWAHLDNFVCSFWWISLKDNKRQWFSRILAAVLKFMPKSQFLGPKPSFLSQVRAAHLASRFWFNVFCVTLLRTNFSRCLSVTHLSISDWSIFILTVSHWSKLYQKKLM